MQNDFGLYFANTLFVTVISVFLIVVVSLFAAYAISRIPNRFTQGLFSLFLFGLAIPIILLYIFGRRQLLGGLMAGFSK